MVPKTVPKTVPKLRVWYNHFPSKERRIIVNNYNIWNNLYLRTLSINYKELRRYLKVTDEEFKEYFFIQGRNPWKYEFDKNIPKILEYKFKKKYKECLEELMDLPPMYSENLNFEGGQNYIKTKKSFESKCNGKLFKYI